MLDADGLCIYTFQVNQLTNMHPKKSPAVRHHGEVADDHQHTTNIEENGLVLRPMAKESDICIPLDREKEHYQVNEFHVHFGFQ